MSEPTPSPLPWKIYPDRTVEVVDAEGRLVTLVDFEPESITWRRTMPTESQAKNNAAFIVAACNSHAALLARLKDAHDWLLSFVAGDARIGSSAASRLDSIEAAIALAEGRPA